MAHQSQPQADPQLLAALQGSEERLRLAVEAGQLGIWDWDIEHNSVSWSRQVYEMHEMAPGSDTGGLDGFRSRIHPDDREMVIGKITEALAGGQTYTAEFRALLPSGRTRWISTRAHLVRDGQGKPLRMVGASTDITERAELLEAERRARGEAEAARRRMELLASAGAELSRSLDPQDTLQAIATAIVPGIADWCRIDLVDEQGVLQRRLAYHRDPQLAERALQMARELRALPGAVGSMGWVFTRGEPYYGTFDSPEKLSDPALTLYTRTFGMQAHYVIPLVTRGRTIGVMAIIQAESGRAIGEDDRALILELGRRAALALDNARLYAQAEAALHQAENANRAKDEFLAMLGHELRNPLAPIASALELMARRDSGASMEERRVIGRQVTHLSRLIDDLLDISRITQGKIQLRRERLDMKAVVANALELTRPMFERHAQPVGVVLADGPAVVDGDAVRLAQVLCNLLVNAAKFTPSDGQVTLSLALQDGHVEVAVQDSGNGIAAELLPRVFEMFVQGRQAIDRQAGGLGLGLAIVRSLVEMHGGSVSAASEGEGRGARFTVRLPASAGDEPQVAPAPQPEAAGGSARILVVDDNSDAASTLADLLGMMGYEVRVAGEAQGALALVDSFAPQLALLDIGLPVIDGYELAGLCRQRPNGTAMKLVALTGYGRDNDREKAMQASFDEHLVKPVDLDKLLQVIGRLLGAG